MGHKYPVSPTEDRIDVFRFEMTRHYESLRMITSDEKHFCCMGVGMDEEGATGG